MPNDLFASIVGEQESVKLDAKNAATGVPAPDQDLLRGTGRAKIARRLPAGAGGGAWS